MAKKNEKKNTDATRLPVWYNRSCPKRKVLAYDFRFRVKADVSFG